ncbi:MAG: hypothetical protein ABIO46_04305 [Chitinophagales bacterium]
MSCKTAELSINFGGLVYRGFGGIVCRGLGGLVCGGFSGLLCADYPACANLRITMTKDNASIDLLTSYSLFALEAKESDNLVSALERPLVSQAIELYRKGFRSLLRNENWQSVKDLLKIFNEKILDINPVIKPLISPLTNELLVNRTTFRLTQFLNKVS